MRKRIMNILSFVLCFLISGCHTSIDADVPSQLDQLPISKSIQNSTIVYLPENNVWVPYLVLSDEYNGNILLLRRDVTPYQLSFSDHSSGYYADNIIDTYLNTAFLASFPYEIQQMIVPSEIEICKDFPHAHETETIARKIFLLSCTEVGIDMGIVTEEGSPLPCIRNAADRIAMSDGQNAGWWLRSTYIPDRGLAWTIASDGVVGGIGVQYQNGLRPALCFPPDTPVSSAFLNGTEVYVLAITTNMEEMK